MDIHGIFTGVMSIPCKPQAAIRALDTRKGNDEFIYSNYLYIGFLD